MIFVEWVGAQLVEKRRDESLCGKNGKIGLRTVHQKQIKLKRKHERHSFKIMIIMIMMRTVTINHHLLF